MAFKVKTFKGHEEIISGTTYYNLWCDPSQKGGFLVCLHPHKCAVPVFSAVNDSGVIPDPLCEPSQNG